MASYANDYTTSVATYYEDLKRYKPLNRVRERKLLKRCKKGDVTARNALIEHNLRFVFDTARRYSGLGVPMGELISEGNLGLLRAINKFDESRDVKFITYAVWWIRQGMSEAVRKHKSNMQTELDPTQANDGIMQNMILEDEEDDQGSSQENLFIQTTERDETEQELQEMQKAMVEKLLSKLADREREVIEEYFGLTSGKEKTLHEIGKNMGLTSERVRQIKVCAMNKLRTSVLTDEDTEDAEMLI